VNFKCVTQHHRLSTPGPARYFRCGVRGLKRYLLVIALVCATGTAAHAREGTDTPKAYAIVYGATLDPDSGHAHVTIKLTQPRQLVRSIAFSMPSDRYLNIGPKSRVEIVGDKVTWRPLKKGSEFEFDFVVDHRRKNGDADARMTDTWALLKLDHLFPPARARVVKGAYANASLKLKAPKGWAIETPYGRAAGTELDASNPDRRHDRPLGWLIAGKLGVRRDTVEDRIISVASPLGSGLQANDVLSFILWTMPSLLEIFPDYPDRLLIVSGSNDMWRGGLSGVGSLYLHPDRPLISGNRTSPMLHEMFHVASRLHGKDGGDWIVEGLAEYYSLTLLLRSGGISERRYDEAFDSLARWSAKTACTATDRSQGQLTARAALVMRSLDREIREKSGGDASLDTLVQLLVKANKSVTNGDFRAAAESLIDGPAAALSECP
jgi:hypothetical protein